MIQFDSYNIFQSGLKPPSRFAIFLLLPRTFCLLILRSVTNGVGFPKIPKKPNMMFGVSRNSGNPIFFQQERVGGEAGNFLRFSGGFFFEERTSLLRNSNSMILLGEFQPMQNGSPLDVFAELVEISKFQTSTILWQVLLEVLKNFRQHVFFFPSSNSFGVFSHSKGFGAELLSDSLWFSGADLSWAAKSFCGRFYQGFTMVPPRFHWGCFAKVTHLSLKWLLV